MSPASGETDWIVPATLLTYCACRITNSEPGVGSVAVDAVTVEGVVDATVVAVVSELAAVDDVTMEGAVDAALVVAEAVLVTVSEVLPPLHALTESATATRIHLTPERYQLRAAD